MCRGCCAGCCWDSASSSWCRACWRRHAPEPARERTPEDGWVAQLRPVVVVTLALIAFGLALETLGLVLSILLLVMIASVATRELKLWETLAAAAGLSVLTFVIFILGLGLTIPVWPDW